MNRPPAPGGRLIADGDLVVVYEGYDSMKAVYIDAAKGQFCNRHGNFPHSKWIGTVRRRDPYMHFMYLIMSTPTRGCCCYALHPPTEQ
eukprot:scaffold651544_cov42-Prasinocladus_malaysianus.AAC.1